MNKPNIICIGELLVDLIGDTLNATVGSTANFSVHRGGSPVNLAMNLYSLGRTPWVIACVGKDSFGDFLCEKMQQRGLSTHGITKSDTHATSVIFIAKSETNADFVPYRAADFQISPQMITDELLSESKIVHTTFFALSKNPAQNTILDALQKAHEYGNTISVDVNYAEKIWGKFTQQHATEILKKICSYGSLLKISDDDANRLFGEHEPYDLLMKLHQWGAKTICYTQGSSGTLLLHKGEISHLPAEKVETVIDTTGAGDTYWSGFLHAILDGKSAEEAVALGSYLSAKKLSKKSILSHQEIQQAYQWFD